MFSQNSLIKTRLCFRNYHWAQYETRLVTSHIWLESLGHGNELIAEWVIPKLIIPQGVVLESLKFVTPSKKTSGI